MTHEHDLACMRRAIEVARQAVANGNHPFGAVLADADGTIVLEGENTVPATGDCTGHAETNLLREASQRFSCEQLAGCTMYASTEPCAMCAAALHWSGVRRLVYGCSAERMARESGSSPEDTLAMPCRTLLARSGRSIAVVGPLIEDEAAQVHSNGWANQ